jgi:hypothetical protein
LPNTWQGDEPSYNIYRVEIAANCDKKR